MLPLNSVKLIDFTWARNVEILFELFISMYSINNIIYMYTIINVILFFFSRFERVSNVEQTEQSNSTLAWSYYCIYHFEFEFVYKCCFLFGSVTHCFMFLL